ncbi:4'-phosphopantetheinyl transferase family protein [Corynebacterium tapiri]|uniref:4'-phosphopantetheinyl transferase superfamily protein n=1 Tax=Corynebacterium tapiri TaxID=1448266 RepID=A0A5C4U6Y3_9CORY|nr:4'-phosphopantetheinyl transferase superfamily protein [Corynebacterium tapiri]TNL99261.1 4'-phosphopantetheinyl transferase superfamily protein [Corynebacterium tapiri]
MISDLFPPGVTSCALRVEEDSLQRFDALDPQEKSIVDQAVNSRKSAFGDARWCAHQALQRLGNVDQPIGRGERGMPLFPGGTVGTLTHTEGLRAAAVARAERFRSLGLDVEPAEPLPDRVVDSISRPAERELLDKLNIPCADRLLFCAKEATYKAWFPLTLRWLGFEDADIDVRSDGTFISYLLVRPTPVPLIEGRWRIRDGFVWAATTIPRR